MSPELEDVRALMQTDPKSALETLQNRDTISDMAFRHEYSVLLAEALYKNYLPQSNFNDVKAAMLFYDSLHAGFQCARAHYYHAVGLNERDDIVGSCEHYLKALELLSEIKEPDHVQTRFIYLTYTRLGELFYDYGYFDLSLRKYRMALGFSDILDDTVAKAYLLKNIGHVYYMLDLYDSSLCYYNDALKTSKHEANKFDVEKPMACILFKKGYSDSAYNMLNNNISKIQNFNLLCSYYNALGEFYFNDNIYDTAIVYFDSAFMSDYFITKTMAAKMLSAIYDSLGDDVKKHYYSDFVLKYSVDRVNKSVDIGKMQDAYAGYNKRKIQNNHNETKRNMFIILAITAIVAIVPIVFYLNSSQGFKVAMDEKNRIISDAELKNVSLEKKLITAKTQLKSKEMELTKLKDSRYVIANDNRNSYYDSEICKHILGKVREIEKSGYKPASLEPLSKDELTMLLHSADEHLDNLITNLTKDHPNLDEIDKLCICLSILKIDKTKISHLLNKNYKTIWRRFEKIKAAVDAFVI